MVMHSLAWQPMRYTVFNAEDLAILSTYLYAISLVIL
jgi:hypothetical protein